MNYSYKSGLVRFLLTTIWISTAFSQKPPVIVQASGKAVFLSWKRSSEKEAFHVYRQLQSSDSSRKCLTLVPVVPLNHRSEITEVLGEDCNNYLKRFGVTYPEQIVDLLAHNKTIEAFACALDPRLAVICGNGYIDTAVTTGQNYIYSVNMIENGIEKEFIKDVRVNTVDHLPSAPMNVRAVGGDGFVNLYWTQPDSLYAGADVYRSTKREGDYAKLNRSTIFTSARVSTRGKQAPAFHDTANIVPEKVYWYKLASRDVFGNVAYSSVCSAVPYDSTPPSAPIISGISIDTVKHVVTISWRQPDMTDVRSFYIYASRVLMQVGQRMGSVSSEKRSCSFKSRVLSGVMWYRVGAIDSYGNVGYSRPKPINSRR